MIGTVVRDFWDGPKAKYYEKGMKVDVDPESIFAKFFRFDPEESIPTLTDKKPELSDMEMTQEAGTHRGPGRPPKLK